MNSIFEKRNGRWGEGRTMVVTVVLAFTMATLSGCDSGSAPRAREDSIAKENKELVSAFFQYFSDGEIDQAFALVDDDVSWWVPGDLPFSGTKTKAEYMQVVASIQQGFPDGLRLVVTSMIAEGNQVAAEVASEGTHANGKDYMNRYHFLITIEDGKMVDVKEYMDTLHLFQLIQP